MNTRHTLPLALVAWAMLSGSAQAFSDPMRFSLPIRYAPDDPLFIPGVEEGGGGAGRWFTGSPADAYTCEVCHSGGQPLDASLLVVPAVGSPPGTVEITLRWAAGPQPAPPVAGNFEVTDDFGNPAGTMTLPAADELTADDQCALAGPPLPAATIFDAGQGRPVIGYLACGGKRVRFRWTPPVGQAGPFWFAGAIVRSNDMGDPQGDGVTVVQQPVLGGASQQYVEAVSGGCDLGGGIAGGRGTGALATLSILGLLLGWPRRRRGRKR